MVILKIQRLYRPLSTDYSTAALEITKLISKLQWFFNFSTVCNYSIGCDPLSTSVMDLAFLARSDLTNNLAVPILNNL